MASIENQNISIELGNQKEVVIRHGEAIQVREPIAISIEGDINAPREFFTKRKTEFSHEIPAGFSYDSAKTNLVINKEKGTVTLSVNEESYFKGKIIGTLKLNPILAKLRINDDNFSGFTPAELAKILRMNRHLFPNKEFFNDLIKSLQEFKAKFDTAFENTNDKKGNIANSVVKNLVSKHEYNFAINLPIFEGLLVSVLPIEVDIDYSGDAQIKCNLISVQLNEEIELIKESIIADYQELFSFCPVIIQ